MFSLYFEPAVKSVKGHHGISYEGIVFVIKMAAAGNGNFVPLIA